MINYLKGQIAYVEKERAIIEVQGIGYEVFMSSKSLGRIGNVGEITQVFTCLSVKDDGLFLYGFYDIAEREIFTSLITVSGVGPKMALAALSCMEADEIARCIVEGDVTRLCSIPGVGKKTAQRMIFELQGTMTAQAPASLTATVANNSFVESSMLALESMGFSQAEVSEALQGIDCSTMDEAQIIKLALKNLGTRF